MNCSIVRSGAASLQKILITKVDTGVHDARRGNCDPPFRERLRSGIVLVESCRSDDSNGALLRHYCELSSAYILSGSN